MNNRSKEIIEEVISKGIWTWLEVDKFSNSLYLGFENLKLSSDPIVDNSYRGDLSIRFGQNISFTLFYNDFEDLNFFFNDSPNEEFEQDNHLTFEGSYFYKELLLKVDKFKFQNHGLLEDIIQRYSNTIVLIDNCNNYDFFLCFECINIAIKVCGDYINCFNDSESLNNDEIKRMSNVWMLYYLNYWNKKGTENEYEYDSRCEEFPLR